MGTILWKIIVLSTLCASAVQCEPLPLSNQYGVPGNFAGSPAQGNQYQQQHAITNSYGAPLNDGQGHDEHQDYIDSQPKSYEFGYAVRDEASGNDFGRRETSDGDTVRGEYRVQLPDGRTQIVTYTADWRTGFHADVRYEGVAQFPDQYNNGKQGYNSNTNNAGLDYAGNNIDSGYNNGVGNHGGYNNYQGGNNYQGSNNNYQGGNNNYQGGNGNYQSGNGNYQGGNGNYNSAPSYNYQYGSNSIDGGYSGGGNSYGPVVPPILPPAQPTYGVPFH